MMGAIALLSLPLSAQAGAIDPYIARYFDATEPVTLPLNSKGDTRAFSAAEFSTGKHLFEENCINCHVGGITLPDPTVSLSLEALKGATPPRDTIASLVAFMRQPMVYDGSEETIWCRQVSENWMTDAELQTLSAFLLRATEKAPAWASDDLFH
ncbi:MAG: photosystem II cytochrome PsbV2 [Kaiparowitsia implicata GSE-PSE-MK54-09C]|nr:photosystem II cytochrome PsbV2 [Kaiparowitsia implicata GSE-PSE-MK54-09C]